jgi:hypothetical protein
MRYAVPTPTSTIITAITSVIWPNVRVCHADRTRETLCMTATSPPPNGSLRTVAIALLPSPREIVMTPARSA